MASATDSSPSTATTDGVMTSATMPSVAPPVSAVARRRSLFDTTPTTRPSSVQTGAPPMRRRTSAQVACSTDNDERSVNTFRVITSLIVNIGHLLQSMTVPGVGGAPKARIAPARLCTVTYRVQLLRQGDDAAGLVWSATIARHGPSGPRATAIAVRRGLVPPPPNPGRSKGHN